jgi:hypothetical protein
MIKHKEHDLMKGSALATGAFFLLLLFAKAAEGCPTTTTTTKQRTKKTKALLTVSAVFVHVVYKECEGMHVGARVALLVDSAQDLLKLLVSAELAFHRSYGFGGGGAGNKNGYKKIKTHWK